MNKTNIEWVKNPDGTQGYTWNPITGCLNGCSYCYARKLANGRLKQRYLANRNISPAHASQGAYNKALTYGNSFYPRFWSSRLEISHHFRFHRFKDRQRYRDRGIFVCDMSDLFGDWIPREWQEQVFQQIKECPNDRFYLLTKQPQNLIKWSPFPDNCWVGVTATDASMCYDAMDGLYHIKAKMKYISFEPVLDRMNGGECDDTYRLDGMKEAGIKWVIIGSQTNPYKSPKLEWVQEIIEAADKAGISVFLKNNLYPLFNVKTQKDAFNLHINYPWAFKETKLKGENDKVEYRGRVISLRQEMPGD